MASRIHSGELNWPEGTVFVEDEGDKADVMSAADLALACSGTVTTELAIQGCPVIVGYRLGWLTWLFARFLLLKARFITLFNVAADQEIAPEFIQTRFTVDRVKAAADALLDDPEKRRQQADLQYDALKSMGLGRRPAHEIAAEKILSFITKKGAE